MISHFSKHLVFAALVFLITACGGGKKSTNTGDAVDFSTDYSTGTGTGSTSTLGTIPSLYDTNTNSDPLPQTGTAVNYGPISQSENLCLSSDTALFNQFMPSTQLAPTACYSSANAISPEDLYAIGLSMWGTMDQCLTAAMSLEPKTNDQSEAWTKSRLAEMIIIRCVRNQLRTQWGQTRWSGFQNQNYAAGDNLFYSWLTKVGNSFMGNGQLY